MCSHRCRRRLRQGLSLPPPPATSLSRGGSGHALWCGGKARCSRSSTMISEASPRVELGDQSVPGGGSLSELRPKALAAPPFKRLEFHALLLDPGKIAEVKYPRALAMGQFENVVVCGA